MRFPLQFLLCCALLSIAACYTDPDPRCNTSVAMAPEPELRATVPYQNGERQNWVTSEGREFVLSVARFEPELPRRAAFCNLSDVIQLTSGPGGPFVNIGTQLAGDQNFRDYEYIITTGRQNTVSPFFTFEDFSGGMSTELRPVPTFEQTVIASVEINDRIYTDVLANDYDNAGLIGISRTLYHPRTGFIYVEHADGLVYSLLE